MGKDKNSTLPTESEWLIMEAVWEKGDGGEATSAEIIARIHTYDDMTDRTIRVLITLLCKKGLLGYRVDEHDSRVYHYFAKKSREACLRDKSDAFANSYFRGDRTMAAAAFLQGAALSDEEIKELEELLKQHRKGGR